MHKISRPVVLLALVASLLPLTACANRGTRTRADTRYVARDVNTLYNAAFDLMRRHNYAAAAIVFDEVER